ncbi:hypothetical protein G9A89_001525 [Geosiphon pyriformis]|nr:hypothetical protein G9A89_001525 [Geosiphon pyriformis]
MLLQCTTVCFDFAELLDAVLKTMPVLKKANLYWFHLVSAKCAGYGKLGHTLLVCPIGEKKNVSFSALSQKPLSNSDKNRLAAIYVKCLAQLLAQIAGKSSFPPLSAQNVLLKAGFSSEVKPTPLVSLELNDRFIVLKHSLTSLTEHVNILAKRLDALEPTVSQLSLRCVAIGSETVAEVVVFDSAVISKMEETLNNLSITVMSLSAKMNNANLDDIICWHKEKNNLIVYKFDGVQVFTSGLESGYLIVNVVVVMNSSLARYVCKISEVPGWLLSIKLFFKNRLSVSILGLYAGASLVARFSHADNINSLIAKTVNESFFIILRGDFNEDGFHKCASFKKCLNFGLVNALNRSSYEKSPTWFNFCCVAKIINYVLISLNLVNAVVDYGMFGIEEYFDTNHQIISILVGLGGLLDVRLNSVCKQANKAH